MADCEDKAIALREREALASAKNYRTEISVGVKKRWIMVPDVLDTEAGLNLLKKSCVLHAWARLAVTMRTTRPRSAAKTQPEAKEVVRLEAQMS